MMLGRILFQIRFVKWDLGAEQVTSLLSLHITISGIWIFMCLIWKIAVPHLKYMDEQWMAEE